MRATGTTRRSTTAAAAVAAILVLGACGAGQQGTIGYQEAAINGAVGEVGDISVLDAKMLYPEARVGSDDEAAVYQEGDDVPLIFTLANASFENGDELVSITTPVADSVEITGATEIPASARISTLDPVALGEALKSSTSVIPSARAEPGAELNGVVSAEVTGLSRDVLPGLTVQMTFTFERAGDITVPVPLAAPALAVTEPEG